MKKIYILLGLFITISFNNIWGQPITDKHWELSSPEPVSREYVARDYIKLLPGFSFTTEGSKTFLGRIDESLLFNTIYDNSQADPNGSLDKTLEVGSLPGNFNVSATGAAIYSIPIEVPPGTAGMQPSLSIVYNSQSGNGLLGYGTSISGLSAISKVPTNIYYDDISKGMFDPEYMLDGQRLILTGSSQNGLFSEEYYSTEIESYSKIICFLQSGVPTI
ncbi:MAG: hypothetical protein HC906_09150 [Bacteroidales bacterium]|nr:hypothetical protein [Bacteroidales bacterium]